MIRELHGGVDGDRVLARSLVVVAVENPSVGDWSAYVVDVDNYDDDAPGISIEEYAARHGDKLSEDAGRLFFHGRQCPRGEYRR